MVIGIIVHGGAWDIPEEAHEAHLRGVAYAAEAGHDLLRTGASAVEAVEEAVRHLEEDPTFDAGRGSFLNSDAEVEMDAMIIDGRRIDMGAVAAVQGVLHPVSLARAVMERTEHTMLVGEGAMAFAREIGVETLDVRELITERERRRLEEILSDPDFRTRRVFEGPADTVGAVAVDAEGHVAAATSTGGTPNKRAGRVGDSPLVGSGAYADDQLGGASTTGWGESIMKVVLAKYVCDAIPHLGPEGAAIEGIGHLSRRVDGVGGVIALSPDGEPGFFQNTPRMAVSLITPGRKVTRI